MLSLVIPLYRSEENLERLFAELSLLAPKVPLKFEVVFVIDGSPDRCDAVLAAAAPALSWSCRVVHLSRNFGAFAAITAGLRHGNGDYFAVLAADLQEPPELVLDFLDRMLRGEADIVFGVRSRRSDPFLSALLSKVFWRVYRRIVNGEIPSGGVDIFGCTRQVRDQLLTLREADSSLIALLFWIGFRRAFVTYERRPRREGKSAWTMAKKLRYALNSIFNFTDLPIRILFFAGGLGTSAAVLLGIVVLVTKLLGDIPIPGYTPIVLSILFFGGLTALGLGIVGEYLWITLQNTRNRPGFIVRTVDEYSSKSKATAHPEN
jgi:glycosyltransferase involved in cell wall biosynthesis